MDYIRLGISGFGTGICFRMITDGNETVIGLLLLPIFVAYGLFAYNRLFSEKQVDKPSKESDN